jgi:hypothetical protein
MESRRNQFPRPPLLEAIVTSFPRNCIVGDGPTDQPTDRRTQSLIEVLFAPKKDWKKVALIKTDYEEEKLQPTQAGHPTFPLYSYFEEEKI